MKYPPGPDPDFPYLGVKDRFPFPDPGEAGDDIVAVGGNLSPGMLLSAYEQGIFPWYNPGDPILWQSPDPRFVIFPETLHISQSMRRILRRGDFEVTLDGDFAGVIRGCAEAERPGQGGTWISGDIISGYTELYRLGYVHSAESRLAGKRRAEDRLDGKLAGGCYGVLIGGVFCGESMFAKTANASKAAFLTLARHLFDNCGVRFIDCQVPTDHLRSLGGREMSRREFLGLLRKTLS
ncbi:MAG: leucyl/phenylalanyl-tRNA--protein transferase [Treponema sp.]|jgi:leucyl/phenylalanyl-tRNA--protein transferase|nr:leucyl/phenylalanyl-tRNA--protein transferase [Treponema sp.]